MLSLSPKTIIFCLYFNDLEIDNELYNVVDENRLEKRDLSSHPYYAVSLYEDLPEWLQKLSITKLISNASYVLESYGDNSAHRTKLVVIMKSLQRIAKQKSIDLLFAILPDRDRSEHEQLRFDFLKSRLPKDIKVINLNHNDYIKKLGQKIYLKDDNHFSVFGNKVVAEILYDYVI